MRQYGYAIARRVRIDGRQKADGYDAVLRKKRIFVPPNPKFKNLTYEKTAILLRRRGRLMQLLRQTDRPRRIGRHRTAAGIGRRL